MRTAVETLIEIYYGNEGQISIKDLEQAKEMEKEQIEQAYIDGARDEEHCVYGFKSLNEYYNITFKSE